MRHLPSIVALTNAELVKISQAVTTSQEVLKFFGVLILITRFEFTTRASLWSSVATSKYLPAPALNKTQMSRNRFDHLLRCIRFSEQPSVRPEGMSSERWRWKLVDDFVDAFNLHRQQKFTPSDRICVDESISRWYGQGGQWINHGLPNYIAIDRKPESGCEIQNAACGRSGIMLRLKLVKTVRDQEEGEDSDGESNEGLIHGCVVLKELVEPWFHTQRTVCADSYFASVSTAQELGRLGLGFVGVVKTASRKFPMAYLQAIHAPPGQERGWWKGVVNKQNGLASMYAFVWVDRERRFFITNTSSLCSGQPYTRIRWRQLQPVETQELPERVELTIDQPEAAEVYYDTCGKIDLHNRRRHDTLRLERKLEVKDWSKRVNLTILGMIIVDSFLLYSQLIDKHEPEHQFYTFLAEELIDNTYDSMARRSSRQSNASEEGTPTSATRAIAPSGRPRAGINIHLTPTKRRRKETKYLLQGRCTICAKKTTHTCSRCADDRGKDVWLCTTKAGRFCFSQHLEDHHDI